VSESIDGSISLFTLNKASSTDGAFVHSKMESLCIVQMESMCIVQMESMCHSTESMCIVQMKSMCIPVLLKVEAAMAELVTDGNKSCDAGNRTTENNTRDIKRGVPFRHRRLRCDCFLQILRRQGFEQD
jgi:hypothetical protein